MDRLKLELLKTAKDVLRERKVESQLMGHVAVQILKNEIDPVINISSHCPRGKVLHFISSTFEDTQFEQDFMLLHCFPFLRQYCDQLGLDFDIVSMRWGVRARANNAHRTSEMCLEELHYCLEESLGIGYISLQSHRYGFQPFPRIIESAEFEAIKRALSDQQVDISKLEEPYWKLNSSVIPSCFELQPIVSIPGLEAYLISDADKLRMAQDDLFKTDRLSARSDASGKWWAAFEEMQALLRRGVLHVCQSSNHLVRLEDCSLWEKYFISVTHAEVQHGLLNNTQATTQALYINRIIEDIDQAEYIDKNEAYRFKDADYHATSADPYSIPVLHEKLKSQSRRLIPLHQQFSYTAPFLGDGKLSKSAKAPLEWHSALEALGMFLLRSSTDAIMKQYKPPGPDISKELQTQHMAAHLYLQDYGFDREALVTLIAEYCTEFAPIPAPVREGDHDQIDIDMESVRMLEFVGGFSTKSCIAALKCVDNSFDDALILLSDGFSVDECGDSYCSSSDGDRDSTSELSGVFEHTHHQMSQDVYFPLILHGESGSGKSWLVAHAVSHVVEAARESHLVLVYRLLGRSVDSSDVLRLITSIDIQLAMAYGRPPEVPSSATFEKAATWFAEGSGFTCATREKPLVIILDGIDQLCDANRVLDDIGQWCPGVRKTLPKHVKLVITSSSLLKGRSLESKIDLVAPTVEMSKEKLGHIVKIPDLPFDDLVLVQRCFRNALQKRPPSGSIVKVKRIFSDVHLLYISQLLEANPSAISFKLLLDIASKWPSYYSDESKALKAAAEKGVDGLINLFLCEVEDQHGRRLVEAVLSLITLSAEGLSIRHLEDIVSTMDEVLDDVYEWWTPPYRRLPPMLIHKIIRDLDGYMSEQGSLGGGSVYRWSQKSFVLSVQRRYELDGSRKASVLRAIGKYFCNLIDAATLEERRLTKQTLVKYRTEGCVWDNSSQVNKKRCIEGAKSFIEAGMLDEARDHLCDLNQVCAYVRAGMGVELLESLLHLQMKYKDQKCDRLQHYIRWFQQDITTITTKPELNIFVTLSQQPERSIPRREALKLLSDTGGDTTAFTKDAWIRSKQLGYNTEQFDNTKVVLAGHDYEVLLLRWSPNSSLVASTSRGNCIRVWDVSTGAKVSFYRNCRVTRADWIEWSPSSALIASYPGYNGDDIVVWDPLSNSTVACFPNSHLLYWCSFGSPRVCTISSGLRSCSVIDSETWAISKTYNLDEYEKVIHAVWIASDRILLVCLSDVKIWNIEASTVEFIQPGVFKGSSGDRKFVLIYVGDTLQQFRVDNMEHVHSFLPNHYNEFVKCSMNTEGNRAIIDQMNSAVWYLHESGNWRLTNTMDPYHSNIWSVYNERDNSGSEYLFGDESDERSRAFGHTVVFINDVSTTIPCVVEYSVWIQDCVIAVESITDPSISRFPFSKVLMINPLSSEVKYYELGGCTSWSMSPNLNYIAIGTDFEYHFAIKIRDIRSNVHSSSSESLEVSSSQLLALSWIPNSVWIVSGSKSGALTVWNEPENTVVSRFELHTGPVLCLSASPCGSLFAAGSDDCTASLWMRTADTEGGSWYMCAMIQESNAAISAVSFCSTDVPDTHRLAVGTTEGYIILCAIHVVSAEVTVEYLFVLDDFLGRVLNLPLHSGASDRNRGSITSLSSNPTFPNILLSGSGDGCVRMWDTDIKSITRILSDESVKKTRNRLLLPCKPVAWHPRGLIYAVGCSDVNCLKVYDTKNVKQFTLSDRSKRNMMSSDFVFKISWTHCGTRLASCSAHGYIRVWSAETQSMIMLLEGHTGSVFGVSWNAAHNLASCGADSTLRVWDAVSFSEEC